LCSTRYGNSKQPKPIGQNLFPLGSLAQPMIVLGGKQLVVLVQNVEIQIATHCFCQIKKLKKIKTTRFFDI
jgi:hypothetical protein